MSAETADLAIDVAALFELDHPAVDANRRVREFVPDGFALDATHIPHLTLVQLYCAEEDLDPVRSATSRVLAKTNPEGRPFGVTANGIMRGPMWPDGRSIALAVASTRKLAELHAELVDALTPYSRRGGTKAAFQGTGVSDAHVDYVENFIGASSGADFAPHVTVGVGTDEAADAIDADFAPFEFAVERIGIARLGVHCTCHDVVAEWRWQ